jgi:hypothetical protein
MPLSSTPRQISIGLRYGRAGMSAGLCCAAMENLNREKGSLLPIKAMQIAASALIDTNQIKYLA